MTGATKTYRLEPIEAHRSSHHWRASTLAPTTVWVAAENEDEARRLLTLATIIATKVRPGTEASMPPWMQPALVSCGVDTSRTVEAGYFETVSGNKKRIKDL